MSIWDFFHANAPRQALPRRRRAPHALSYLDFFHCFITSISPCHRVSLQTPAFAQLHRIPPECCARLSSVTQTIFPFCNDTRTTILVCKDSSVGILDYLLRVHSKMWHYWVREHECLEGCWLPLPACLPAGHTQMHASSAGLAGPVSQQCPCQS